MQEGTQTNFFADVGGTLYTAPLARVLGGTIRAIVVSVCEKHQIPLKEECVTAGSVEDWNGAFVCSTSRLVLPVSRVFVAESGCEIAVPPSPTIERVAQVCLHNRITRAATLHASVRVVRRHSHATHSVASLRARGLGTAPSSCAKSCEHSVTSGCDVLVSICGASRGKREAPSTREKPMSPLSSRPIT